MHKRDYLVKQIEEFAKVMSILLGLKRDENYPKLSPNSPAKLLKVLRQA